MRPAFPLLVLAAVSACSASPSGKAGGNDVDPAIAAALADPLMADPALDRRSNNGALRPADQPFQAMVPPGVPDPLRGDAAPGVLARLRPAMADGFAGCRFDVAYSYGWAARVSPELALPSEAQVAEAAGSDAPTCALRLVAWSASPAPDAVLAGYRRLAGPSGYALKETTQGSATIMTARRARDGAAFVAIVTPASGGSVVDLASNRGR
jgi:hypothetical protein